MKLVLHLITVIAAIILITFGVNHISKPSNLHVWLGLGEVILAFIVIYFPIKQLFKKL